MEARRQWANILKMLKEKNNQPKILYPAKLWSEGEIKTFPDKQKTREFVTTRSALREMLKGVLESDMRTGDSSKPVGEIKISVKINIWAIIKAV